MLKKFIIKSTALFAIMCTILYVSSLILVKPWYASKMKQGFYNPDTSYDAVFLGSSHMNGLLNPNIIDKECNISSYNYGTGGQPISVTYSLLKEILNNNPTPKVVILDVYYLGLTDCYGEEGYIRYVLDNMKFSKNKIEAVFNSVPVSDSISYLFPIFKYHNTWTNVNESSFDFSTKFDTTNTGFSAGNQVYGIDLTTDQKSDVIGEIPEYQEKFLNKIIDLSKEYDFDLILVNAPYDYTSNDNVGINWHPDDAALMNRVDEIAKENSIPFINYSTIEKMNEINFVFKEDMNNSGHTNIYGAEKISRDIAKYLNNNYNFKN